MFFDLDIKGDRLPPKTLCLTYDDGPGDTAVPGPGPRTRALGRFLFEQGIRATFFQLGRHVEQHPGLPEQLRAWGHLVGNHTYSHPGLVALAESGGDVIGEVARADALIGAAAAGPRTFLRAPYGNWRAKVAPGSDVDRRESIVAAALNRSGRFPGYVGPVNWDISSLDWEFWGRGDPAGRCADALLEKVERIGRGIILMHDSSEDPAVRANNRSAAATALLVAALRPRGYRFVRLDAIPQARAAARVAALLMLRSPAGQVLVRGAEDAIGVGEPSANAPEEPLGVVPIEGQRFALCASNGQYLAVAPGEGEVAATAAELAGAAIFQAERLERKYVALRAEPGGYLARGPGARLLAVPGPPSAASAFVVHHRYRTT
jgi:peptidoglycan/xylan/chitin deacetylase (PgdA/CDA1 family)